mmetsp:Transcript_35421/g.76589  ORF Transcript_35421/g.76589 Transcript_35421/m.76589 type:complete len:225 (+) Transcript_35421:179-853(+)
MPRGNDQRLCGGVGTGRLRQLRRGQVPHSNRDDVVERVWRLRCRHTQHRHGRLRLGQLSGLCRRAIQHPNRGDAMHRLPRWHVRLSLGERRPRQVHWLRRRQVHLRDRGVRHSSLRRLRGRDLRALDRGIALHELCCRHLQHRRRGHVGLGMQGMRRRGVQLRPRLHRSCGLRHLSCWAIRQRRGAIGMHWLWARNLRHCDGRITRVPLHRLCRWSLLHRYWLL